MIKKASTNGKELNWLFFYLSLTNFDSFWLCQFYKNSFYKYNRKIIMTGKKKRFIQVHFGQKVYIQHFIFIDEYSPSLSR